ncbi:MAG: hypothetical protein ACFFDP_12325 [Promethearchaeota archaeon]
MVNNLSRMPEELRKLADPLFWFPFLFIIVFKLGIFHLATVEYLAHSYHYYFGMDFWIVEAFSDFKYYYLNFVNKFLAGNLPYTEALWAPEGVQVYIYPPLFLYITTIFYFIPSEFLFPDLRQLSFMGTDFHFARIGFSFVFFDIATCIIIYAAAKKLTSNRVLPLMAMLLYALNPVALWWGDYMWLSTPIHTFFLILGFYFMIRGDLYLSAFWVAIATMIKQTAGLLIPVILFLELARSKRRLFTSLGIMASVGIICSMPYLILYPGKYIGSIIRGMGGYWFWEELPVMSYPIPVSVLAFYWPSPLKDIVFIAVANGIPWGACLAIFWACAWIIQQKSSQIYQEQLVTLSLLLSLSMHIFWPRGIFKYYLIALLPFLILYAAILRGPIIRLPQTNLIKSTFSSKPLRRLPAWISASICQFTRLLQSILNNRATWWLVIVGIASIGIFSVHRYLTHAILLPLFLFVLIFAWYKYSWKTRSKSKK